MADLTPTAANVVKGAGVVVRDAIAGAAVTAGEQGYLDATDGNKAKPGQATSEAAAAVRGVFLNSAAAGQPCQLAEEGPVDMGAGSGVAQGQVYVVSAAAAGGIAPEGDLGSGNYVSVVGVGDAGNVLRVKRHVSGVAHA